MKRTILFFVALYASVAIVACAKNGTEGEPPTPPANNGCAEGSTFIYGQCYTPQGQVTNSVSTAFVSSNYNRGGQFSVANSNSYKTFLREALAICDRGGGYNAGYASCDSYVNGYALLTLQAYNVNDTSAYLTIEVAPRNYSTGGFGYGYSMALPTAGQMASCGLTYLLTGYCYTYATAGQMSIARNPLQLQMTLSRVNADKGFEGRAYGAYGTPSANALIQLIVVEGSLQEPTFSYQLAYKGQSVGVFATGQLSRCGDSTCGLQVW